MLIVWKVERRLEPNSAVFDQEFQKLNNQKVGMSSGFTEVKTELPKHGVQSAGSKLEKEQSRGGETKCCGREERNQTVEMKTHQALNQEVKKRGRQVKQEEESLKETTQLKT